MSQNETKSDKLNAAPPHDSVEYWKGVADLYMLEALQERQNFVRLRESLENNYVHKDNLAASRSSSPAPEPEMELEVVSALRNLIGAVKAEFRCICDVDGVGNHAPICPVVLAEAAISYYESRAAASPIVPLRPPNVAMSAWQVLGAIWGISKDAEQCRIMNWFWEVAHGEMPAELFPLKPIPHGPPNKLIELYRELAEVEEIMDSHDHKEFESCEICGENGKFRQLDRQYWNEAKWFVDEVIAAHLKSGAASQPLERPRKD